MVPKYLHLWLQISEFCGTLDPSLIFEEDFELKSTSTSESTSDYSSACESRRRSGVILLAQRLMGGSVDQEKTSPISSG